MSNGTRTPLAVSLPYADAPVRTSPQLARRLFDANPQDNSVFTFNGDLALDVRTLGACDLRSFEDDFYNAIYFIPDRASLSSVSSNTVVPAILFNAFRDSRIITDIILAGDAGILVDGPQVNFELLPLGLYDYDITVSPAGPPDIDFLLDVRVTGDQNAEFALTGQRSTPFFFLPNWLEGVQRIYEFRTDIARGRTQREARRRIRSRPRISFAYQHVARQDRMLRRSRLAEFFNFMQDDPSRLATMPDWASSVQVALAVPAGDTVVELEDSRPWAIPGQLVFVYDRTTTGLFIALIEGSENGNTRITLQAGQPAEIPAGAVVYRAVTGRVAQQIGGNMLTDSTVDVAVEFAVDPGQENLPPVPPAEQFFQGREIFDFQENWATPPTIQFAQDRIVLDNGFGRIEDQTFFEHTPEVWQLSFSGLKLSEVQLIENFFLRMEGRAGEFWRSKRLPDLFLEEPITAGQTSITVKGSRIRTIYENDPSHVAIELQTSNGTILRRAILAYDTVPDRDVTIINFNEPFPDSISLGSVTRVSWFQLWRLATDSLTVNWATDTVANVQIPMLSLVVEAPE